MLMNVQLILPPMSAENICLQGLDDAAATPYHLSFELLYFYQAIEQI